MLSLFFVRQVVGQVRQRGGSGADFSEAGPVLVSRTGIRQRIGDGSEQPTKLGGSFLLSTPLNANAKLCLAQGASIPMCNGLKVAFREQVVHVHANVLVIERQQKTCSF